MTITAPKPVTKSEFEERMALAKQYGPVAVHNLIAEFRQRVSAGQVQIEENAFGFTDLSKCGLEAATAEFGGVTISVSAADPDSLAGLLAKRHRNATELEKLEREMNAHDGPPTPEETERYLRLKYGSLDKSAGSSPIAVAASTNDENALTSSSVGF